MPATKSPRESLTRAAMATCSRMRAGPGGRGTGPGGAAAARWTGGQGQVKHLRVLCFIELQRAGERL